MPTEPPNAEPPKRQRRWFQFSLRTLLIGVTLLAVPCAYVGWQIKIVQERRSMLARIASTGGEVMMLPSAPGVTYSPVVNHNGKLVPDCGVISAFRHWLGDEAVVYIKPPASMGKEDIERIVALFPDALTWVEGDISISFRTAPPPIAPLNPLAPSQRPAAAGGTQSASGPTFR
jgi:hypothetical protein